MSDNTAALIAAIPLLRDITSYDIDWQQKVRDLATATPEQAAPTIVMVRDTSRAVIRHLGGTDAMWAADEVMNTTWLGDAVLDTPDPILSHAVRSALVGRFSEVIRFVVESNDGVDDATEMDRLVADALAASQRELAEALKEAR